MTDKSHSLLKTEQHTCTGHELEVGNSDGSGGMHLAVRNVCVCVCVAVEAGGENLAMAHSTGQYSWEDCRCVCDRGGLSPCCPSLSLLLAQVQKQSNVVSNVEDGADQDIDVFLLLSPFSRERVFYQKLPLHESSKFSANEDSSSDEDLINAS